MYTQKHNDLVQKMASDIHCNIANRQFINCGYDNGTLNGPLSIMDVF